jgi:oxygen-independent coproporphyrinogen-3 oxidase
LAGIYVHIPFCKHACSYCDFHFSTTFDAYRETLLACICEELVVRKSTLSESISTIYFGGGTPSILSSEEIALIITTIKDNYSLAASLEITLETNPEMMSRPKLQAFKDVGINRLSVGIQSFDAQQLSWMERTHSAEEAENCVKNAQTVGIENISIDLIYGLPNQTLAEWKDQLKKAIAVNVQHISSYCLTVEKGTKFGHQVAKKTIQPLADEVQMEMLGVLETSLQQNDFEHYEISNFAKPGFRSKHNTSYWEDKTYLGVGPSAHSFFGATRSWNIANNQHYIKLIQTTGIATNGTENLSSVERANEKIMTRLRMSDGLNLTELEQILPLSKNQLARIEQYVNDGLLDKQLNTIRLTRAGKRLVDRISSDLFFI